MVSREMNHSLRAPLTVRLNNSITFLVYSSCIYSFPPSEHVVGVFS